MASQVGQDLINANEKARGSAWAALYKKPIRKNYYKLDTDNIDTPQEVRRQRLLQFQKKCRENTFNAGRGILDGAFNSEEDEGEEYMEIDQNERKTYYSQKRCKYYANQLMLSEWMLEVPQDFLEKWIIVPCPQGKRTLVVACKGITKAYNRRGNRLGKFHSALPGGNPTEHRSSCTILDCLWIKEQRTYYALDVLAWSNQSLLNCDTEFRFFWLNSQLQDIRELQGRGTYSNTFPILSLPNVSCKNDISMALAELPPLPPLDGLLFYHREGQYTKGHTPLVTWLKPFMLSEVLGIFVPSAFDEKPDDYIDFRHYILSSKAKKKHELSNTHMEISEEVA